MKKEYINGNKQNSVKDIVNSVYGINSVYGTCVTKLQEWGIYVCAHARYKLLDDLYKTGSDGIYCDTDII